MGVFKYPYTDFHEMNMDWIIKTIKELIEEIHNFVQFNSIKYADPFNWSIDRSYEENTMVFDDVNKIAYISKQPVPSGVLLSNDEYWLLIMDLSNFYAELDEVKENIGDLNDLKTTLRDNLVNAINEIYTKSDGVINPDMFPGTSDYEKLQATIDYAVSEYYPTIIINRLYDITGHTIKINKGIYKSNDDFYRYRGTLTFLGIGNGEILKSDYGFMFSADTRSGFIAFNNIKFRGGVVQTSTMTDPEIFAAREAGCSVFDTSKLIYINTYNCTYQLLGVVFDGKVTDGTNNAQSINSECDDCFYTHAFMTLQSAWNININNARIEVCNNGIIDFKGNPAGTLQVSSLNINDSLIESIENGYAIDIDKNNHAYAIIKNINITNDYFEQCSAGNIHIDINTIQGVHISGNYFTQYDLPTTNCIEITGTDAVTITKNHLVTGSYGIYLISDHEIIMTDNDFAQVDGLGSLTNSTLAIRTPIKIYKGSVTSEIINGNASAIVDVSDIGTITNLKSIIPICVTGNNTWNTTAIFSTINTTTKTISIHTYGSDAQAYGIEYYAIGY